MPDARHSTDLDALVRVIESLQERIRRDGDTIGSNEIRTRTALVDPLLNALGWDTTDPAMVVPEYAAGGGIADYALLKVMPDENTPVIAFIEAKRLNEPLESHRAQMLNYANMSGVKYAGLTNGDRWELYEVFKEAPLHERRIVDVSLLREPAVDCAAQLLPLEWPSLETGEPFSRDGVQQIFFDALMAKASPAVVATLLTRGANANVKLGNGWTLLHWAIEYAEPAVVSVLLDHGADINAKDEEGLMPLHLAARFDQHKEVIALLLERGAHKEAIDGQDGTPLHVAAVRGAWAAVELLLDGGSDTNIKNQYDQTPLQWAIEGANAFGKPIEIEHVVSLLLDRGASIQVMDTMGCTPLHSAAVFAGEQEFVTLLLNRGADIDAKNNAEETPLHQAAINENYVSARLLLGRGADIEASNHQGFRPLHLVSQELVTWYPVVSGKVAYPVPDVPATAPRMHENGMEYVGYAHWETTYEIVKLLLEYGANPRALTHEGMTAYHIAEEQGASEEVLNLLRE